ncbi:DUF4351 domain-containing protein [Crocosphaera sp. UHCC 0190]|uniref:DUF4351 domain-containing protein n=1 Tax=Crocosphaera sp. UHCC 0190 TaxID=3110246 RepID=UPI002B21C802|nr:DUF4351 domain-containing protein [Crocosphaera sp. UHCC 0190]MEA5511920.1 DUF4351 domain-containing protein [Crocosphaera sp. UHCC 0190]
MYDSTRKFIATHYSRELATWLLGKPMELTEIKPSELSLEPIRADSLIFLTEQSNLAASTAILAGLVLNKDIIQRLLRNDIMKESVIYQEIEDQGRQKGETNLILRLLNRRIGEISPQLSQKIQSLSIEQLENLGEALLDFHSTEDLEQWFNHLSV